MAVIASSWSIGLLSGYGGGLPCQREITKRKSQLSSIQLPTALLGGVSRNRITISADPIRYKSLRRQGLCLPISNDSPKDSTLFSFSLFPTDNRNRGREERKEEKERKEKKRFKTAKTLQLDFVVFLSIFVCASPLYHSTPDFSGLLSLPPVICEE